MARDGVIIVGAGVAGLAAALALKAVGVAATIIEQRSAADLLDDGTGIQIGPNGTKALSVLGVLDRLAPHAQAPESIRVHDGRSGRLLTRLPLGGWIAERLAAPYWVVHRADLVRVLYDAVREAGIEITCGRAIDGITIGEDHVTAGDVATASALIGADGLWSRVRGAVFDQASPKFTCRVAWRAILPAGAFPAYSRRDVSVWMSPHAHLVVYPIRSDAALNVVLIAPGQQGGAHWSEAFSTDEAQAHLSLALSSFHEPLRALAMGDFGWRRWPLLTRPALTSYARGRVALIGDAAHPILPFLAQGGAMALEDALALGAAFQRAAGDPLRALADYAARRLQRTQRVVAASERNGRIYHLAGPAAVARNAVLRLAPPEMIMRGYDWLYGGALDVPT